MAEDSKKLYDLANERVCLASLIKHPSEIAEYINMVKPKMFYDAVNQTVYSMITNLWLEKGTVDPNLLVAKLHNSGFSTIGKINAADYIETLTCISVSKESIEDYFKEGVWKYYWLRDQWTSLTEARSEILKNCEKPLEEILPMIEKKVQSSAIQTFDEDDGGFDIYGDMMSTILDWGENKPLIGIRNKFPEYTRRYDLFTFGDLTIIAAPSKVGKSTFLNSVAFDCATIEENNCKVFYADAEMEAHRAVSRGASALSGVKETFIKKGTFKDNKDFYNRILAIDDKIKKAKGRIKHYFVPDKNIDEVISLFRRWYYLNVKEGENVLFIYDYLKMTGEATSQHNTEYQIMTEKATKIKHLMSEFPRTTGLCAVQLTDEGSIAQAKRIGWVASNVFRLFKKTPEEIIAHGKSFGTHKLVPFLTRIMGEGADGFEDYLEVQEIDANGKVRKKLMDNYINFQFDNFKVEERGGLEDAMKVVSQQLEIEEEEDYSTKKRPKLKYERENDRIF